MRYIGQLMMLMVNMVLLCYTCACFWFWYVKQTDDLKYSDTDFIEANVKLEDESESRQFLRTLYFILTTVSTVGYGDYLPKNTSEYAVVALIMLTGVAFFAYVMGLFNTTIAEYDELTSGDDELSSLNIWMD
jgi:potassium voltage-gated channel Eag-related subfamily H protein 8